MIPFAQIAQSVEQRTENPRVAGSIPALGILFTVKIVYGRVAQVVEHLTFNQVVRGSNPRTLMGMREKQHLLSDVVSFFLFVILHRGIISL